MRKVLIMLLCSVNLVVSATDYYVSTSGSNSATGLSTSTPWQTIGKVNSESGRLLPGDKVLFKRGEVFTGTLILSVSGSSGNPITIGAYGTGANPVISGFTTISGWNNYGGGIYSKSVACESRTNMVTVNGVNTPMGKLPNTGFLTIDSHVSNTSITDSELPSSNNWTGAEVIIRKNAYIWDRNTITSHSGTTLYYTSGSYYNAIDGYGYFIQNSLKTLDQTGEWYYDGSVFYMYFGTSVPGNYVVKISSVDKLVYLDNKNYITFDNISFQGANQYGLHLVNSDYITVQNCSIEFSGKTAIFGPWSGTSPSNTITRTTINHSNSNGIELHGDHTKAIITNNVIKNTGLLVGMGGSGDGTYVGLAAGGDGSVIQFNEVVNSGYIGIHFGGNNTLVTNNLVDNFNLLKNDGGGIYTYVGHETPKSGQIVTKNIVLNGMGFAGGMPDASQHALGIYLDDGCRNVEVSNNTLAGCATSGIYLHNAHEIKILNNTLFNNGNGKLDFEGQVLFVHDNYLPDDPIRNVTMTNNIFFAKTLSQKILAFSTADNDIAQFGTADLNCYAKPIDNSLVARTWTAGWNSPALNLSLAGWRSASGQDKNSFMSPVAITDVNRIRFEYNTANSNKVITLNGGYIDMKGTKYSGSLTLLPYSSVVLIADSSTPPAVTPPPATNIPPVVVVKSASENLSGLVSEIDATGSYDPNNDVLSYSWVAPANIPVSSTSGSKIQFLNPIVNTPLSVVFTLKISDGKTIQTKEIPVVILPNQPELEVAEVLDFEASSFQSPNYPHNIMDGNIGTMWAASGVDQWIIMELKSPFNIQHVKMAFIQGQKRVSYFDVLGSDDKVTWEPILIKSASCGFSGNMQVFSFPPSKADKEFKYVKLIGQTNSVDSWNYISEFKIFGYPQRKTNTYEEQPIKIYPNPAHELINIRIDEATMKPDFIRIITLSGKIVLQEKVEEEITEFQMPIDLKNGVYIIQMGSGELTLFAQKLIVNN